MVENERRITALLERVALGVVAVAARLTDARLPSLPARRRRVDATPVSPTSRTA